MGAAATELAASAEALIVRRRAPTDAAVRRAKRAHFVDVAPERARVALPAAPDDVAWVRGTDGRTGAEFAASGAAVDRSPSRAASRCRSPARRASPRSLAGGVQPCYVTRASRTRRPSAPASTSSGAARWSAGSWHDGRAGAAVRACGGGAPSSSSQPKRVSESGCGFSPRPTRRGAKQQVFREYKMNASTTCKMFGPVLPDRTRTGHGERPPFLSALNVPVNLAILFRGGLAARNRLPNRRRLRRNP